jgi:hypothetical protein
MDHLAVDDGLAWYGERASNLGKVSSNPARLG